MAVKLAPVPRQQYVDSSGNPYSGAKLFYYAAGTTTKQNTYTTSTGASANTNPIVLDPSGRTPFGVWLTEGVNYKAVLAPANDTDPPTSPIFTEDVFNGINDNSDATNQWAASGVTPTYVSATQFTVPGDKTSTFLVDRRIKVAETAGTVYGYISASAYTTLTTVTVVLDSGTLDSGISSVEVGILTDTNSAIPSTVAKRNAVNNYTNAQNEAKGADIASAATINLTTATGNFVHVTGTTTITAVTLASGAERTVVFDGSLTLTHNATTLILPDAASIQTAAGDKAVFRGDGTGNTRCISFERAVRKGSDVASASTVNLDAATGDFVHITGTTTITAITLASGRECTVVFDGALTLTHNATTLILPGAANITTAAGDRGTFRGDGSGNTRCIHYTKASGQVIVASGITSVTNITSATTLTAANIAYHTVAMTAIGVSVTLPDATTMTVGAPKALFKNTGGYPFGIRNNAGTLIGAVAAGGVAWVSCDSISTAAGSWSVEGTNLEPGLITIDNTFSSTYSSTVRTPFVALDDDNSIHFLSIAANGFAAVAADKTTGTVGTPLTITTTASSVPKQCFKITSTTAIVFYGEDSNNLRAAVITLSGDTTLAVGTAVNLNATGAAVEDFSGAPKIAQLDSTHYLVSYATATGAGTTSVAALEVTSGTTVTWGTPVNIIAADNVIDSTATYALTATTGLVIFTDDAADPYTVKASHISVSGTTCTVNSTATVAANDIDGTGPPFSCKLSATAVLVAYASGTVIKATALTVSGTTVASGTPITAASGAPATGGYTSSSATRYNPHLWRIDDNKAGLWHFDTSGISRTVILTESGGEVTAGTVTYRNISAAASNAIGFGNILPQGATEFVSVFEQLANTAGFALALLPSKISGTTITTGSGRALRNVLQINPASVSCTRLSSGDYAITPVASTAGLPGGSVIPVFRTNGDAINYRGEISCPALGGSTTPQVTAVSSNRMVIRGVSGAGTTVGASTYQLRLISVELAA